MWVKSLETPGKVSPPEARSLSSSCVRLAPGQRVGEHSTEDREELILVLEGEATLQAGGEATLVRQRHAAYVPPGSRHDVENRAGAPLVYVYVTARAAGKP